MSVTQEKAAAPSETRTNTCTLTKQGLEATLWTVLEAGYLACEKNMNLQEAKDKFAPTIRTYVDVHKLPNEIAAFRLAAKARGVRK